jgi:hypothetical protein
MITRPLRSGTLKAVRIGALAAVADPLALVSHPGAGRQVLYVDSSKFIRGDRLGVTKMVGVHEQVNRRPAQGARTPHDQ